MFDFDDDPTQEIMDTLELACNTASRRCSMAATKKTAKKSSKAAARKAPKSKAKK